MIIMLFAARCFISGSFQVVFVYTPEVCHCTRVDDSPICITRLYALDCCVRGASLACSLVDKSNLV